MSSRGRLPALGARPPRSVAFLSAAFSGAELPSPAKGSNKALQLQLQQQQQQLLLLQPTRPTASPAVAAAASLAAAHESAAATAEQQQQRQQHEQAMSKLQEQRADHVGAEAAAKTSRKHGSGSSSSSARDAPAAKKAVLKKTNRKSSSSSSTAAPQTLDSALALSSSSSSSRIGGRSRAFSPRRLARATEKQQNNVAQGVTCARLESSGFTSSLGRLVLNPGATFGPARAEAERLLCFVVTCEAGRLRFSCGEASNSIPCQPHDEVLLRKGDVYSFSNDSETLAAELTAVADFSTF